MSVDDRNGFVAEGPAIAAIPASDRKPLKAGTRVRVDAPGWASHGKVGTVRYDGGGVVDLDNGKVAAVEDSEMVPLAEQSQRWCILRMSGPSTLRLVASLQDAGIAAWSPTEHIRRRVPRAKSTEFRIAPVMPTYVFVRGHHLPELQWIERADVSVHPRFSIFRYYGDTVFVRHAALQPLRVLQQDSYRDSLPASGRSPGKARGEAYHVGDRVKINTGPFTGFEAFVESSDGLTTTLTVGLFGRPTEVRVPTLQLRGAGVSTEPSAA